MDEKKDHYLSTCSDLLSIGIDVAIDPNTPNYIKYPLTALKYGSQLLSSYQQNIEIHDSVLSADIATTDLALKEIVSRFTESFVGIPIKTNALLGLFVVFEPQVKQFIESNNELVARLKETADSSSNPLQWIISKNQMHTVNKVNGAVIILNGVAQLFEALSTDLLKILHKSLIQYCEFVGNTVKNLNPIGGAMAGEYKDAVIQKINSHQNFILFQSNNIDDIYKSIIDRVDSLDNLQPVVWLSDNHGGNIKSWAIDKIKSVDKIHQAAIKTMKIFGTTSQSLKLSDMRFKAACRQILSDNVIFNDVIAKHNTHMPSDGPQVAHLHPIFNPPPPPPPPVQQANVQCSGGGGHYQMMVGYSFRF